MDPELDKTYDTYLLTFDNKKCVLKKSTKNEVASNKILSSKKNLFSVPKLLKVYKNDKTDWILIEYVEGNDLQILDKNSAILTGKALAQIASYFFDSKEDEIIEESISKNQILSKLPINSVLYNGYCNYLNRFKEIPRTFSHDDLLPINVIAINGKVSIIDWSFGRMGVYITDVSRFYSFYSSDKDTYKNGFSFLDNGNFADEFLKSYHDELNGKLKEGLSFERFKNDNELEMLNQYLMNINHLTSIEDKSISTNWESYFYTCAKNQARKIVACNIK